MLILSGDNGKIRFEDKNIASVIRWNISYNTKYIRVESFRDDWVKVVPGLSLWSGTAYIEWTSGIDAINMRLREYTKAELTLSDSKSGESRTVRAVLKFPSILDFSKEPPSREEIEFYVLGEFLIEDIIDSFRK